MGDEETKQQLSHVILLLEKISNQLFGFQTVLGILMTSISEAMKMKQAQKEQIDKNTH